MFNYSKANSFSIFNFVTPNLRQGDSVSFLNGGDNE